MRIAVQRNVTEDIVKNVGLGQVVELTPWPHGDGGREPTPRETFEELSCGQESRDGDRVPAGASPKATVHVGESRNRLWIQPDRRRALEEHAAAGVLEYAHAALEEDAPYGVVFQGVVLPPLRDERRNRRGLLTGLDHRDTLRDEQKKGPVEFPRVAWCEVLRA